MDVPDSSAVSGKTAATRNDTNEPLILIPLRGAVLFRGMVMPLALDRPAEAAAMHEAARTGQPVAVVLQRDPEIELPRLSDLHATGTEARLLRYFTGRDGSHNAIVQGIGRLRPIAMPEGLPYARVSIERIAEPNNRGPEIDARFHQLRERALEALRLLDQVPSELATMVQSIEEPGAMADLVTGLLDLAPAEKQEVLDTIDVRTRLDVVLWRLAYRLEVLRLSRDIGKRTQATMEGRQREFMLREQLKTIQKELGEADEHAPEIEELRRALEAAGMPPEVAGQARRELRRLERMSEGASEAGMIRSYLEWLTELPWRIAEEPPVDIRAARAVLDEDHFDLEKIKRRILEFLAVRKLNPEGKGPILCFVGPRGWEKPRSASPSPGRRDENSPASVWAGCMTRRRSAVIVAPISARCLASSPRASAGWARATV